MEDQLISFETARLAKEKRFNLNCLAYYNAYKELRYDYIGIPNNKDTPFITSNNYTAPTQSSLQKWLRETFKLHIAIYPIKDIWDGDVRRLDGNMNSSPISFEGYSTYEEAIEFGLQEALKLI